MKSGRFCWVIAIKPEAHSVIEHFSLKRDEAASRGGFPVFRNEESSVWLTISGPGKVNSAAATAWLEAKSSAQIAVPSIWINFGIAGGNAGKLGEVFRAGKVKDESTGRSWFPQTVWKKKYDLPVTTLITVDRPTENYPEGNTLVEMEASGFLPMAWKFAGSELAQVFKVVSDNSKNQICDIDVNLVRKICGAALEKMLSLLGAMEGLLEEEAGRLADPELFAEICDRWHFSVTNRHRLRRLLQQRAARDFEGPPLSMECLEQRNFRNGKEIIAAFCEDLWSDDQT